MPHPTSPCIRAQGEATGLAQVCMLGAILHCLLLTLSPVTHPHSLPRCVLSWMSGIQSCCTVPTGQRLPLCAGKGILHSSPSPVQSIGLGLGGSGEMGGKCQ